jgi:methylase of polypeptide subunit release factors
VFVAETRTRTEAREIHRKLWNLGNAPFIIVLLPNEIRVYGGFGFSQKDEKVGLIDVIEPIIDLTFENIRGKLVDFNAASIDSGALWKSRSKYVTPDRRVDTHLLNNLEKLEQYLLGQGLELSIIHALIGKYVYIRYLYDRKILSEDWLSEHDLCLNAVLSREANLSSLLALNRILEDRFNGAIFPLPENAEIKLNDELISIVASAFKGDDIESGQLHLDFDVYDFSYIPIETLSSIYEQFLQSQGLAHAAGAIYTPEPVADYLLCELNGFKTLDIGMKVLDPCCGSGVFLVLAYRRLIEIELAKRENGRLKPTELRKILCDSIYGVERNQDACYVAEFSLLLTLLNYLEPPDLHRNKQFKFPSLHNTQIFECDFFDNDSDFWERKLSFDWVIGNPPWIELTPSTTGEEHVRKWLAVHSVEQPVGGNRVCEAFSWRVVDALAPQGCVGLLVHANSLFNYESRSYRAAFFKQNEVERVTNFSHFAYVLFGGRGEEPAATLIYQNAKAGNDRTDIVHYAPFILNQIQNRPWKRGQKQATWNITINEGEISTIPQEDAASGDMLVWKSALWGNWRDRKSLSYLQQIFPINLGELIEQRQWHFHKGLEVRQQGSGKGIIAAPFLSGWRKVNVHKRIDFPAESRTNFRFAVPEVALDEIPDNSLFIRERGGRKPFNVAQAPHLVIKAVSGDCAYSDIDFIVPTPQIGISAKPEDSSHLRAISVLLNSSVIRYFLFFKSPSWGVGRSRIYVNDFKQVPLPNLSEEHISDLATFHRHLVELEWNSSYSNSDLQGFLDDKIQEVFSVPETISKIAKEFLDIRIQLNKGKSIVPASKSPTEAQLQLYGSCLQNELDSFTDGSGLRHKSTFFLSGQMIVCAVEFIQSDDVLAIQIEKSQRKFDELLNSIGFGLKQRFSQWVYIQRSLKIFSSSAVFICKPARLIDWTQTQALNDSDDLIAEILSANYELHEVVQ